MRNRTGTPLDLTILGLRILGEAPFRPRWAYYRMRAYAYHYLFDARHKTRLEEYRRAVLSVHDALAYVLGRSPDQVIAVDDSELMTSLVAQNKWVVSLGAFGDDHESGDGPIAYYFGPSPEFMLLANLVCRLVQPEVVIETGVARGFMSTSILDALDRNAKGHLWSIDLPSLYKGYREQLGDVIPRRLRGRWSLELGPSAVVMPRILASAGSLDVSIHDAAANYDNQTTEYSLALAKLRPGGVLISNMVNNDAFIEVAEKIDCRWAIIDHNDPSKPSPLGVLCKLS